MANLRMASNSSEDFVCEGAGGGSIGLDHGAVFNKEITSLKNSRSGYLSWLTRVYGEIESWMSHPEAVNEVLLKKDLISTAFSRLEEVQFSLLARIDGESMNRTKALRSCRT